MLFVIIHTNFLKFLMMDSYVLILVIVALVLSQKAESHNGNLEKMHYDFFDSGCGKLRYVNFDSTYQVECTNKFCFGKHDSCILPFTGSNPMDIVCAQVIELQCKGQIILRIDYRGGYNGTTGFKEYNCLRKVDKTKRYCGKYIHITSLQKQTTNVVNSSIKVRITAFRNTPDEIKMASNNPKTYVGSVILYSLVTLLVVILVIAGVFLLHRRLRQRRNTTDPINLSYQTNSVTRQNHLRTNVSVRYGVVPNEYVDLEGVTHHGNRPHEPSIIPSPVPLETGQQPPDHDMYVDLSVDANRDTERGTAAYQTIWD